MLKSRWQVLLMVAAGLMWASTAWAEGKAKNVIVMISDGTGWQSWDAAAYYRDGELGRAPTDAFKVKLPVTTYALTDGGKGEQPNGAYDPSKAWDDTVIGGEDFFAGYAYLKQHATDSAAAATAMGTGVKTYNAAIGVDNDGKPVKNLCEVAIDLGKSAGVVTSVPLPHATPAGFSAHVLQRDSYTQIAQQMVRSKLTVIMGAGNPMVDQAQAAGKNPDFRYVGGQATWKLLKGGKTSWKLLESRKDFEDLATTKTPPARVFGVPMADSKIPTTHDLPDDQRTTPSLAVMTQGAINVLSQNPKGFFLMVEGGAVDWGAHANDLGMLVRESSDFYDAIDTVVKWVESHGGWDENLIIVTTDHGNGLLLGPESDKVFLQPIVGKGKGELPGARFHTGHHVNELVRLWAHGAGAEMFLKLATNQDPGVTKYHPGWGPAYGDNTDVFKVSKAAMEGDASACATECSKPAQPQPATVGQ
ncbi:MAG: alkaline phosphatase [Phycisphaeraceae bacterium]|nr:alkaline phosphatase [Phycisphaeraceae bacterium]